MANCTVDEAMAPWVVVAVVNYSIVCVLGGIGNICSIWCLYQCKRTKPAMKFQLICVFSLMAACCLITQPVVNFIYYSNTFCLHDISPVVSFCFSVTNSVLLQMDRTIFATVAIFRMVAVRWPNRYTQWCRLQVVVAVHVGIVLYIVPVWLALGGVMGFQLFREEGSVMDMKNNRGGGAFTVTIYVLYYAVPYLVTLSASIVIVRRLLQQKQVFGNVATSSLDYVVRSTTLIILVLLVMDLPHIVLHTSQNKGPPSVIIHIIFEYHLIVVPIIFVTYNPSHRGAMLRLLHRCLPPVCRQVLPPPPSPSVAKCDTVEMRASHKFTTIAQ
ncbi:P2Y purinoceptor 8-like [Portunus trituberculatus]|uniref:P2Y purinoceptor 8-like n=1 Tax=Portunus trituberculatus TaxID=210409 RepID=UPI001E1CC29E|nr:P2Y purinoceptor 8-like [Portunus trituberculatus]